MPNIERGQFSSFLRRYLGMTGTSDVVAELAPEISPSLTLESERPEWEFLKGAKLMSGWATIPALAANSSYIKLRNPAAPDVGGSRGVVAIFTRIVISCSLLAEIRVTTNVDTGANLATTFKTVPRDRRLPNVAFPGNSALFLSGDYATLGDTWYGFSAIANTPHVVEEPFVLTPGFDIGVVSITQNTTLIVAFEWLEKRLDPLEQQ